MKFKLRNFLYLALFICLIAGVSALDSDIETLSKVNRTIVVNQIGYFPQWKKTAFVVNNKSLKNAQLLNFDTEELVSTLTLGPKIEDEDTRDFISQVDFTDVTQPGKYYLKQDKLKSVPFQIGADIYQEPLVTLLRSYYLQRCGIEIDDPVTGISHAPCHIKDGLVAHQDQYHQPNEQIAALGGWHNGDGYSKYVGTTTITIARLLNLYEKYPQLFPDSQLNIPESGNGTSDLLDETRFGLDWLLKMQRADGAVYRKLAGKKWPLKSAPDKDRQHRYIYGISTPETAKFAAVMAIASRNYQSIDKQLATTYLDAAKLAWQYLQTQPEMKIDGVDGDDSGSLEYQASEFNTEASLETDVDDRLWAAVELYITTGTKDLENYFAANLDQAQYDGIFSWKNPSSLALADYLEHDSQPSSANLIAKGKTKIQHQADIILNRVKQSTYNISNDRFIEGSNIMTIEEGNTLVYAYQLTKNKDYLTAAIDQLDYILGRNHFDQTFITGIGTNSVQHLNHLFAIAKKVYQPGLLVGGPNGDAQDGMVSKGRGQFSYIDDDRSYSSNQYVIENNASLISLITNLTVATAREQ